MHDKYWLRLILGGFLWAAFLAAPGLPLPGADRLGFSGTAAAQETIDIDTFYNELAPYGQWVWHPRYGYVWLPETVSAKWRPYTVGRWTYTDEYGWYWDSYEPFAWAVYHYGRWGYDPDYGWFWVPGDTWAPAWVQWRYSDDYVGWAPMGPRHPGYAYGVPVSYDPPIAESWVFVQPRYMTSRVISHYALPVAGLNVAFFSATNVYRPEFRGGVVYNYGMPRDLVVKIIKRPIYVQKIYKVDNWKGGQFDKGGPNKGIKIYAPGVAKDDKPNHGPKTFADNPNDFKPKAKLKDTYNGEVPKGWGPSAKGVTPIAKEAGPDAFKKHGQFGGPDNEQANRNNKDRGNDNDNDKGKGEASKTFGGPAGAGGPGGPGGPVQQTEREQGDQGGKGKPKGFATPGGPGGPGGTGGPSFQQIEREQGDQGGKGKPKGFATPGGPGGPAGPGGPSGSGFQQTEREQGDQGGKGKPKGFATPGGPGGPAGPGGPSGPGFQQTEREQGDQGGKGKPKGIATPGGLGGPSGPGPVGPNFQQGERSQGDQKPKGFGGPGGPGGPNFQHSEREQGDRKQRGFGGPGGPGGPGSPGASKAFGGQGGPAGPGGQGGQGGRQGGQQARGQGGGGGDNKDKCQKHPEKCQNQN